jgi:CPA2 family monovalent cation:H+ antiporter-2
VILIGKPLTAFLVVAIFGLGSKVALGVAVALAQIGEFSLILMSVGSQLNILPGSVVNVIVVASVISLTLNPLFYRSAGALEKALTRSPRLWRRLNPQRAPEFPAISAAASELRAIIVGYGPIGRTVARLLRDRDIRPVFIEMNLDLSRRVRADGMDVVYGEATHPEILEAGGIRTALVLVVSGSTPEQAVEIIRIARQINPHIRVLARTYYLRETAKMRQAGADQVFSGEGEVALAMTEFVLDLLGATPEQTDRERQRVRDEVFQIGQPQSEGK